MVCRSRDHFINKLVSASAIVARCGFGIGTCAIYYIGNMFSVGLRWLIILWAMGKRLHSLWPSNHSTMPPLPSDPVVNRLVLYIQTKSLTAPLDRYS